MTIHWRIKMNAFIFLVGISVGLIPFFLQTLNTFKSCKYSSPVISISDNTKRSEYVNRVNVEREISPQNQDHMTHEKEWSPRKVLLDCGGNVASTVELFRNTYPGGREYIIHSFEIDSRLRPYFSPYQNHIMHCPVGVASNNGNMTAYTESAWSSTKGKNNGKDMQWGGGTLYVSDAEKKSVKTGGSRKLSYRRTIPTVDLSMWIQENTQIEDYVILKLDVEGAEFDILKKMLTDDTFKWIDKYYGEFHVWQLVSGWTTEEKEKMVKYIKNQSPKMYDWKGERRDYSDYSGMHPIKVPADAPGQAGGVYSHCGTEQKAAIILEIGMNIKRAHKAVSIIEAYEIKLAVMLFVYGDFAESYPELVKKWATRFDVGVREDGPYPLGHFSMMQPNWVRESLTSAELRLQEIGIQPSFYLPVNITEPITAAARNRGFRMVKPNVEFPPTEGPTLLTAENYYKFRDVERVPKALRILDTKLVEEKSAILSLDTDVPDTRMNLVFLLDYLVENSGMKIVSLAECIA